MILFTKCTVSCYNPAIKNILILISTIYLYYPHLKIFFNRVIEIIAL